MHRTVAPAASHAPTITAALHVSANFGGTTSMWTSATVDNTGRQVTLVRPAGGGSLPQNSTQFKSARIVSPHQTIVLSSAVIESQNTRGGFTTLVVKYVTIQINQ